MNGTLRRYIMSLRIRELTEVLDRMGMRKNGRKADLQSRVISIFASDGPQSAHNQARVLLAKRYVEEAYCRMFNIPYTPSDATPDGGGGGGGNQQLPGGAGGGGYDAVGAAAAATPAAKRMRASHAAGAGAAAGGGGGDLMALSFDELIGAAAGGAAGSATAIRCLCGSGVERGEMVQCDAPQCHVWQHSDCVAAAAAAAAAAAGRPPGAPKRHYCERCRMARADPFWEVFDANLFQTMKVAPTGRVVQLGAHSTPHCSTGERSFYISGQQLELLRSRSSEFRLVAMAVQLDDGNPFRFHWPLVSELSINRQPVRVYTRSSSYKLGANQRDDAVDVSRMVLMGRNSVTFNCTDGRPFAFALMLMRQRSVQQVKALMMPRESLPVALERVRRSVRAGCLDDDDDIELGNVVVSLKDPYTYSRVTVPARFTDVGPSLEPFDLNPFLDTAQRTRKWTDPHSMKHSCVQHLQVDAYLEYILSELSSSPAVMEVEIDPRGCWRPNGTKGPFRSVLGGGDATADGGDAAGGAAAGGAAERGQAPGEQTGASGSGAGAGGGAGGTVTSIKADPDGPSVAMGSGGAGAAAEGGETSEEEDEMEELRRAAQQAAEASGRRRRAPGAAAAGPEVIELLDSDSDDAPAAPAPAAAAAAAAAAPARVQFFGAGQQQQQQGRQAAAAAGGQQALAATGSGSLGGLAAGVQHMGWQAAAGQQQQPAGAGAARAATQQFAAHNPRGPQQQQQGLAAYGHQQQQGPYQQQQAPGPSYQQHYHQQQQQQQVYAGYQAPGTHGGAYYQQQQAGAGPYAAPLGGYAPSAAPGGLQSQGSYPPPRPGYGSQPAAVVGSTAPAAAALAAGHAPYSRVYGGGSLSGLVQHHSQMVHGPAGVPGGAAAATTRTAAPPATARGAADQQGQRQLSSWEQYQQLVAAGTQAAQQQLQQQQRRQQQRALAPAGAADVVDLCDSD